MRNACEVLGLESDDAFTLESVGESHYQDVLEAICGPRSEDGEDLEVVALLALGRESLRPRGSAGCCR
jgi:hypothetical protein